MIPRPVVGLDRKVRSLAVGSDHCAVVTDDGSLYTWGRNGKYECGLGHGDDITEPQLVSTLEGFPIKKVVCGYNHTAALSEEGYVFTWGMGGSMWNAGALGHGDKEHQPTPVVVDYFYDNGITIKDISSGCNFMLALSDKGDLYSWGRGEYKGALATNNTKDELIPKKSDFSSMYGKIVEVVCGHTSCMMLTEDGNVYTWGRDDDSQLGRGQGLSLDSYAIDYTPLPIELPEGEKVKKMAAGYGSAAIVCESGNIYWWGMKLHLSPYQEIIMKKFDGEENARLLKVKEVSCGGHMVDAITEDGLLYTWGDARKQPYGIPNHHAVSATEVKILSDAGIVYNVAAGQSMVLAAVELH
ncbi:hypothetical protein JH06_1660 [Blastocystis sp. subtype 4]|uniref:hypothetical protein n=1 Tax=Blastocystis sp. subtype 4 TaxID=944170 RepID=UPI000711DADB|nr:hypothetical protein JH06_1660 [Blastocystis sp. subtype 4]KNB44473.1 hypothetical protein JH06_1660 [Blastocystis sp. subtype 4]|eukprot:XP_014527916.1 hypothetical protein JH06_1660 [Blastocystis sp. subtype 4]